jgi:hypothetical protein
VSGKEIKTKTNKAENSIRMSTPINVISQFTENHSEFLLP